MAQMPIVSNGFSCTRCGEQLPHQEAVDIHNHRTHLSQAIPNVGRYRDTQAGVRQQRRTAALRLPANRDL